MSLIKVTGLANLGLFMVTTAVGTLGQKQGLTMQADPVMKTIAVIWLVASIMMLAYNLISGEAVPWLGNVVLATTMGIMLLSSQTGHRMFDNSAVSGLYDLLRLLARIVALLWPLSNIIPEQHTPPPPTTSTAA